MWRSAQMTRRLLAIASFSAPLLLIGCFGSSPEAGDDDTTQPDECQLDSKGEASPGYPYDVAKFRSDVLPVLIQSCGSATCHAQSIGGFQVWANAATDDCNFGKTFNQVAG